MKKFIYVLSASLLMLSVFSACSKDVKSEVVDHPNTSINEAHSTTSAEYTLGAEETSQKIETGKNTYEINYYDENGHGVKKEFYEKKDMKYYIEISGADEDGNATQEKYYKPDGTLFGVFDSGFFYDGEGNQISEDVMEANLYNVTHQEKN